MSAAADSSPARRRNWPATVIGVFLALSLFSLFHLAFVPRINSNLCSRTNAATDQDQTGQQQKSTIQPSPQITKLPLQSQPITCDRSHHNYDICYIRGPTVLDPTTTTFHVAGPTKSTSVIEKIRPWVRKWDNFTMSKIKEVTLRSSPLGPLTCDVVHNAPALLFSVGSYIGNFFHEFNDGFLPLFTTVRSVFPVDDRDFVLVMVDSRDWWFDKYADLLHAFSKYPVVDVGKSTGTHCFSSAVVGLISHGSMTIDSKLMPDSITLAHFRSFLGKAYGGPNDKVVSSRLSNQPRLVLLSRMDAVGRRILNQAEVEALAREVGFEVVVFKPELTTRLKDSYALINTSHVVVGVHGAALTHMLFLQPGSVLIQVVPIGLEWVAYASFGKPGKAMGLDYLEYKIKAQESSLIEKYKSNETVIKDPTRLKKHGWPNEVMKIYLREQDVRLDLVRFRGYLEKAYQKAKKFMDKEGDAKANKYD